MRLSGGTYALFGFEDLVNCGFVVGREGLLVIDTTMFPSSARAVLGYAREVAPGVEVKGVVYTHHHPDHTFGACAVTREPQRVAAHRSAAAQMESLPDYPRRLAAMAKERGQQYEGLLRQVDLVLPKVLVDQELTIELGGRSVLLRHVPGHTAGDLAAFVPEDGVLFAGDLVYSAMPYNLRFGDLDTWADNFRQLIAMHPAVVVPGHGLLLEGQDLAAEQSRLRRTVETLRAAVAAGNTDPARLAAECGVSVGSARRIVAEAQENKGA